LAKAKRVFEIAKELGVASKAIVAKCQAEGLDEITNHMSTVKLGLEMTIREWFSEAEEDSGTAVETAEKVDLAKARKARRRRAKKAGADTGDEGGGTATAVEEPPAAEEVTEEAAARARTISHPSEEIEEEAPAIAASAAESGAAVAESEAREATMVEAPAEGQPTAKAPKSGAAAKAKKPEARPTLTAMGRPNVPDRPTDVRPVGPQLDKPKEVTLKGPKVVRIEKPDDLPTPRRRRPSSGAEGPSVPDGSVPGITRSRGPARGRGAGDGPATEESESAAARGKRRSLSTRRGRSADGAPSGRTKFTEADMAELDARLNRSTGFVKRRRQDLRKREPGQAAASAAVTGGQVEVAEPLFIKNMSSATGIKSADIIKYLFKKGIMANINSAIDPVAAQEVALEYNIELIVKPQQTAAEAVLQEFEEREPVDVRPRPPIVAVLGHVDHGKTSLLDRIRKADVAAHEAGGITQHVGAYRVTITGHDQQEKTVVFLDTPGHEAFTSMRARGASVTDLVVLVVAADDGVMPQTVESINHAKAAGVPIIVALNKIDKQEATEANIRKIYGQLAEHGLNPTEWGGDTEVLKVSATKGVGITELMEVLDYQAELLELKSDYGGNARGVVIEAEMKEGRGPVARVLVDQGHLQVGNFIVIGRAFGRVRDMTDDRDRSVREAGPASPLELSGIDMVPDAGDKFYVTDTLQKAEQIAKHFREVERHNQLASQTKVTLDTFADHLQSGHTQDLRVVLKADVQGSIETLKKSLEELGNDEVAVRVLHAAVGGVTESDVLLADASDAVVIGFHVVAPPVVRDVAEQRKVEIRLYRIIYELIDDVKAALEGMLTPETRETAIGEAEVREVFRITKVGAVAGCLVTSGVMERNAKVRVTREGVVVTEERNMESLRRVKDDVKEVRAGTECGIKIAGFDDLKQGDVIHCYKRTEVKRKLG
jgi:translation initiation factor IF-2